jgi:hypothetical protein
MPCMEGKFYSRKSTEKADIHHVYTFRLRILSYDHEYFLAFITFYLDIIDHCLPKERFNYSVLILCRNGRKGPKTLLLLDYSGMAR